MCSKLHTTDALGVFVSGVSSGTASIFNPIDRADVETAMKAGLNFVRPFWILLLPLLCSECISKAGANGIRTYSSAILVISPLSLSPYQASSALLCNTRYSFTWRWLSSRWACREQSPICLKSSASRAWRSGKGSYA